MRKILLIALFILVAGTAHSFRIPKPPSFAHPLTRDQVIQLNDSFENIWNLQRGEFNLDIETTPKTQAGNGDFWMITGVTAAIQYKLSDVVYSTLGQIYSSTNYISINGSGQIVLNGTARVNKEFRVPLTDFNPGASGPTKALNDIYPTYEFTIDDDMHTSFEMPPDWAVGTNITVEVYWAIDEALGTDESVQWESDWRAVAVGEVISAGASGTVDFGDVIIPAVANTVIKTEGIISGASLAMDDLIAFNGSRIDLDNGATNDPTAEPYIVDVRVEYLADKLGE